MKKIIIGIATIALVSSCSLTRPYAVTNNAIGEKTGVSKTTIIFGVSAGNTLSTGIVSNKDFGVIEAAKNGGINKIGSVDVKTTNFLFFQKVEIIVTGE
jgi:hypothetical protein